MGCGLHYSVATMLVALLAIPGRTRVVAGEAVAGLLAVFTGLLASMPAIASMAPFGDRASATSACRSWHVAVENRQFAPNGVPLNDLSTGFPNTVPTQFPTGFPGGEMAGVNSSGPVGSWWPGDWGSGGYYGYAYPPQAQAPAPEPQVIVIHSDGQDRMTTAEAPANYSYVKGCHAIANGYHCDTPTATP